MKTRYVNSTQTITDQLEQMINTKFPDLNSTRIKILLDTKKKSSKKKLRLAEIKTTDELNRYFSMSEETGFEGYDFILIIDQLLALNAEIKDLRRVLFHELCHADFDDKGKPTTIPHDFEGFYVELKYNRDDRDWGPRLTSFLNDLYESEKAKEE